MLSQLQNNRLRSLPNELADINTIEELNVDNNPPLQMVPRPWQGDSESVMFICKLHRCKAEDIFLEWID